METVLFIIIELSTHFDSEDDCCTSCGNVSHCQQQYYSGLRSPTTYIQPWSKHLGTLKKLDTKTHFAKLTHVLPLKKAWGCCYKGLFLRSPSLPSSVDCVALKLECITSTLHRGEGEGKIPHFDELALVCVPGVLPRVVMSYSSKKFTPGFVQSLKFFEKS